MGQEAEAEKRTMESNRNNRRERKLCRRSGVEGRGRSDQKGCGCKEPWRPVVARLHLWLRDS